MTLGIHISIPINYHINGIQKSAEGSTQDGWYAEYINRRKYPETSN